MSEQMLKSLSQIEIETLCIVTAVKKDTQLTHFTQIILWTDSKAIQYLVKWSAQYSKLSRWSLYLGSLPLTIAWVPASHPAIRFADMMGRCDTPIIQSLTKNTKPKAGEIDKGPYFDLSALPAMKFNDAVALITELQNWQELHSHDPNKLPPLPSSKKLPSEKDPLNKAQSRPEGRARRVYFSKEN